MSGGGGGSGGDGGVRGGVGARDAAPEATQRTQGCQAAQTPAPSPDKEEGEPDADAGDWSEVTGAFWTGTGPDPPWLWPGAVCCGCAAEGAGGGWRRGGGTHPDLRDPQMRRSLYAAWSGEEEAEEGNDPQRGIYWTWPFQVPQESLRRRIL